MDSQRTIYNAVHLTRTYKWTHRQGLYIVTRSIQGFLTNGLTDILVDYIYISTPQGPVYSLCFHRQGLFSGVAIYIAHHKVLLKDCIVNEQSQTGTIYSTPQGLTNGLTDKD